MIAHTKPGRAPVDRKEPVQVVVDGPCRERCRACWKTSRVGFAVPNAVWQAVVPAALSTDVLCLACFTEMADERGVQWDQRIDFFPVSATTVRQIMQDERDEWKEAKEKQDRYVSAVHHDLVATARLAEMYREALERIAKGNYSGASHVAQVTLAMTLPQAILIAKAETRAALALGGALRGWEAAEDASTYYGGGGAEDVAALRVEAEAALRDLDAAREGKPPPSPMPPLESPFTPASPLDGAVAAHRAAPAHPGDHHHD